MDDLSNDLVGTTATTTFTVEPAQTTNVFGRQERPPGRPAAVDSTPDESVRVLGTASLLSQVEFTGRESLAGKIQEGAGVVGKRATVTHENPATVGTRLRVQTEVVSVDNAAVTIDGEVRTIEDSRSVGTAETVLKVVDRERFRRAVDAAETAADNGEC